jgi:hypothetical protein
MIDKVQKPSDPEKIKYYIDRAGLPREFTTGSLNFRWLIQET